MKCILFIFIVTLSIVLTAFAEEESTGGSGTSAATFFRKLEPNRLLTSGGIKVLSGEEVTVEPEFGVSHVVHQREAGISQDVTTHNLEALAGGRVRLSDRFYLGFATKLPIYNYGATEGRTPGGAKTPGVAQRHEYEILRLSPENLKWTGELGFRLGQGIDMNLYYDQNILNRSRQPGIKDEEEVFGTRFILRFE